MSEHPNATALAQDALGQPAEQNRPFGACKALTAGHEEAQVFGRDERASRTHTFRDSHCPAWWQAALVAAMLAELLPWLIMRYLGEISSTEDRASRGRTGLGLASIHRVNSGDRFLYAAGSL
jgi:hypothetical protein